ncbi:gag-pol fusion polyprotein [Lasius niger]|uniref:Gag-pol fusion polyprotein n=1 Tax=Lasius niger TaxID=67767 RepID=A0A0J7MUJ3_LASNI|nr:gag-pol fusion polyprotein [Lasius niger]
MTHGCRQNRATQTAGPIEDVGVQVGPVTIERAAQTDPPADNRREAIRAIEPEDDDAARPGGSRPHQGCWNCGDPGHYYSECPRPRDLNRFCFRCGRRNTTVKDCPGCHDAWRAQGPYVRGLGHEGPEPPRRGGSPSTRGRAAQTPP